jgi:diacylglycerol kinase family enzyme
VRGFLIVNPHSGNEAGLEELQAAAQELGIETHVLAPGEDLEQVAKDAATEVLGMAGGDGSLACVASVCLEREITLVCVPFGTRNHFARDLGLDLDDPIAALDAFTDENERLVDVARANDRLFLNNVSIGAYASLVRRREHHRRRGNVLARLRGLGALISHRKPLALTVDGEPVEARIVLVSNNAYELEPAHFGERQRLDEGLLHLYVTAGIHRPEWRDRAAEHFTVSIPGDQLDVAVDGEPEVLEVPIEFRIEPRALRVLLPSGPKP